LNTCDLSEESRFMTEPTASFLAGLNPPQKEAALHTEGPLLVLAGAGSGKTRVITCRIAHLLASGLAKPEEILAVTFTNKAAAEMRERVAAMVGKARAKKLVISTFHSFCLGILREHIEHIGYRKNFSIASESDARVILRRVVDDLGERDKSYSPALFHGAISLFKNSQAADPHHQGPVKNETEEKYQSRFGHVYDSYQSALLAANSVDFDDLLLLTLKLWRQHPAILEKCRGQFRYVMVDEYQDTNKVQFDLMHFLVDVHQNFCVVGDDDQSIYAWRGADSRLILEFEKHFKDARIITLDQNYRSTNTILQAANSVIAHNSTRRVKNLWSDLGEGRPIDWIVVADEEAEAQHAIKWLQHIMERTGAKHKDFALLYRSNIQSKPIEIAFRRAGIPYAVYGGQDFFERAEVKDIVSYLKIISNPRDEAAFLRVVNMPRRGIGDQTLHHVHELCRTERLSLGMSLAEILKRGSAPKQAADGIRAFLDLLQRYRKRFREDSETLRKITEDLVIEIDYRGELDRVAKNKQHADNRWQNVVSVLDAIEAYEKENLGASLSQFLDASHLNSDTNFSKQDRRNSGVSLMTIHSAKGLEFPFVFLMGVEEGILPHTRSIAENSLDEERRLFYVALTRGKRHVTLFECLSRTKHGREKMCSTSRFLPEIPAQYLKQQIKAVREMVADKVAPDKDKPKPVKKPRKPATRS